MAFSNTLEKVLFSQHFYSGLQVACGVLGLAFGVYILSGWNLAVTALMTSGAVCVSVADVPSPVRHKRYELLAALTLGSLSMLLVSFARHWWWALGLAVLAISFFTALLNAYGKKAMPVSFSGVFAMVMAMGAPLHAFPDIIPATLNFSAGAVLYMLYALLVSHVLGFRTRQQAFAESCFELAKYLRVKATFYEQDAVLDQCYGALVRQQAVVVDKQQTARDFVLNNIRSEQDARLAQLFLAQFDIFELILASHTDYAALQQRYGGTDLLMLLRDLVGKAALDLDRIAYTALRNQAAPYPVNYKAELFAIRYEIGRLEQEQMQEQARESANEPEQRVAPDNRTNSFNRYALDTFKNTFDRISECITRIESLHRIARTPTRPDEVAVGLNLQPFLTPASYHPRVLLTHCRLDSPFFRYALRMTLAMGCGFAFTSLLFSSARSYWILLTIAVVMRSSFSMTLQRRTDRILGNISGCILTALLLHFTPHPVVLLFALFVALAVAHAFVILKYRYTAIASCVMALLQIHFLNPGVSFVIGERLADTLVGALLAYGFSFILPSWESRGLPQFINELLEANKRYLNAVLDHVGDFEYRLARKQMLDGIAAVSGAFARMLQEPKIRRHAVAATQEFITINYLFTAHLAALHVLLQHSGETEKNRAAACSAETREEALGLLTDAQTLILHDLGEVFVSEEVRKDLAKTTAAADDDSDCAAAEAGRSLLEQRIAGLSREAREIRRLAAAMAVS